VGFGLFLMFSAQSEETWRTAGFTGAVACVGAAIVCSWLIAGVSDAGRGRWQTCVLIGVAASGAALAAGNQWVVPALLFWVSSSVALAALCSESRGRVAVWLALFASDACLVAGLIGNALDTESWAVPQSLTGWPLAVVLASAVIRAGALPRTGIWGALESDGASALPLISAGAFTAVTWALGDPVPWLGVGLVVVAILTAIWGLLRSELSAPLVGAVPVALALGVAVAEPGAAVAAGVAAVIAVALVALWPVLAGRGETPRALHIAFVPPTIGFLAVVAAAVATFDRAVEADRIADIVVNTLFSALLPVALAVSVALGTRIARSGLEFEEGAAESPIDPRVISAAAWALLAASVAMTIVPPEVLGMEGRPLDSARVRVLLGIATAIGAGAAYLTARKTTAIAPAEGAEDRIPLEISFRPLAPATEQRSGKVLGYVAALLALATLASVGWFTVYGMRLGFL
jgi:hypothetical protein